MNNLFRFLRLLPVIFLLTNISFAQQKTVPLLSTNSQIQQPKTPKQLPADLIDFFAGEWSGQGEFASGKKIEADISFTVELDNYWLLFRHTDRAPNKYKALGMWGYNRETGQFIMTVENNFGGSILFVSNGWTNGKIIFLKENQSETSIFPERFTYEKQTDKSFKMTFENMKDGKTWKMGDYLVFTRK